MIETPLIVIFVLVIVPAWILYDLSRRAANSKGLAGHEIEKARRERYEKRMRKLREHINSGKVTIGIDKASGESYTSGVLYSPGGGMKRIPPGWITEAQENLDRDLSTFGRPPIGDPSKDAADVAGSDWGEL